MKPKITDYEVMARRLGHRYRWELLVRETSQPVKYSDAIYKTPTAAIEAGVDARNDYVEELSRSN